MKFLLVLYVLGLATSSLATNVKPCKSLGRNIEGISRRVLVGKCNKPPCKLRKNTTVNISIKFVADEDITDLKQTVNANILGIDVPFIGVDGESACEKLYELGGKTKVGCNLKKGQEYEYHNSIDVLSVYPEIRTVVHWGLTKPDGKDIFCFETPARIVK